MAENTLPILQHLTSSDSPFSNMKTGFHKPSTIFFSVIGSSFFMYTFRTAVQMHALLALVAILLTRFTIGVGAHKLKAALHG